MFMKTGYKNFMQQERYPNESLETTLYLYMLRATAVYSRTSASIDAANAW